MRIYLDVCCLNRPFDDQTQDRIRIESEAVLTILNRCLSGEWQLVGSEVVDFEISKIPDEDRKQSVSILTGLVGYKTIVDEAMKKRAVELQSLGFKPFDALHIACAESGDVDVFLTTDDALSQKTLRRNKNKVIKVRVANPLKWVTEVMEIGE